MPLHPPKFDFARMFYRSWRRSQTACFDWFPIFSSEADRDTFTVTRGRLRRVRADEDDDDGIPVDEREQWTPLVVEADMRNPVTSKRLRAIHLVFAMNRHAFALGVDAETVFASRDDVRPMLDALLAWSNARQVLAARLVTGRRGCASRAVVENCSCAFVGQQPRGWFYWWVDAPIFERADYEAFYANIAWSRLQTSCVART